MGRLPARNLDIDDLDVAFRSEPVECGIDGRPDHGVDFDESAHDPSDPAVQSCPGGGNLLHKAGLDHVHPDDHLGNGPGKRPDRVEKGCERPAAADRYAVPRSLEADDSTTRSRNADRSAGVSPDTEIGFVVGNGHGASAR